jgi:pimeloyl-ACP methyl ester carboxylesterase
MPDLMQIDEHFIEIDGRQLFTKKFIADDDGIAPTIVLIHDALGSIAQWKDFPEKLCSLTGLNVFLYDRFGHGQSASEPLPPDENFLDREALVILPEVLYQVGIDRTILYGHSDGGTIAMIYASQVNTSALVLEAAHVLSEEITRKGVRETSKKREELVLKLQKYHGDKAADLFAYWSNLWSGEVMKDWNIEYVLKRIDTPTLIIQGELDNYGTLAQVEKIRSGITGQSTVLIIEQCGHAPHKDQPGLVLENIKTFLNQN